MLSPVSRRLALLLSIISASALWACRPHHVHQGPIDPKVLFRNTCAQCHGEDGHGQTEVGRSVGAKDLTRDEARRLADPEIAHQIKLGRGKMPAFGMLLDDQELQALVAHVRTLQGKRP